MTAVALAFGLTGCFPSASLTLTPAEDNEPACTDLSTVLVENLHTDRTECDLAGASVTYPDGTVVEMDQYGGSGSYWSSLGEYEYAWVNVGNYGVVAGWHDDTCARSEIWGTAEGKKRVLDAFGETWPCPSGPDRYR